MLLKYRRDIDGLRAVAVLAVVIYHLGLPFQFDGFVGVDIFFVISGFLITGILYKDIVAGTFSVTSFYARRVKRILPALYVVTFCTVVAGIALLLPNDLREVGESGLSTILSASNIYFWYGEDTSYFARSSELIPLLHTWSLGIEEQFYLVWPLLLLITYRLSGFVGVVLTSLVIAVASYGYAEALLKTDASLAYYMLTARAGELLTGALAFFAIFKQHNTHIPAIILESIALLGVLLIAYSLFFADSSLSFPGVNSIYPCVGTALIIYSGGNRLTLVSRVLSIQPLVWIGLISYSLYLWHWPILAYTRYLYVSLSALMIIQCLVTMSILSFLSYKYVEVPLRARNISNKSTFVYYLIGPAVLLVPLTVSLYVSNGLESTISSSPRFQALLEEQQQYTEPAYRYDYVCQSAKHSDQTFIGDKCIVGLPGTEPDVLLWGDSHAAHHVGFLAALGEKKGFAIRNLEVGNCPPLLRPDIEYGRSSSAQACTEFRARIKSVLQDYQTILLGASWSEYFKHEQLEADLRGTIEYILGLERRVVLLGEIPKFKNYDRDCQLKSSRLFDVDCAAHAQRLVVEHRRENENLQRIADEYPGVSFHSIGDFVCDPICSPYREGKMIYFDPGHLSMHGSRELGKQYHNELPDFSKPE